MVATAKDGKTSHCQTARHRAWRNKGMRTLGNLGEAWLGEILPLSFSALFALSGTRLKMMSSFAKSGRISTIISNGKTIRLPSSLRISPIPFEEEEEDSSDDNQLPIDLSVPQGKGKPESSWHLCELCDNNFSSLKILQDHMWTVHKTKRVPGIAVIPDIEITPIIPAQNANDDNHNHDNGLPLVLPTSPLKIAVMANTNGRSLADEIIYHPPASTRRRTSNSSSSGSNSTRASISGDSSESDLGLMALGESCRVCFEQFDDKRLLGNHMKMFHPMDNRFNCTLCDRVLSSRAALQGHLRIHTGEKPHCCSVCKRAFSNSQTLSRHMRTHTGEKPYECGLCGKRASLRHNMKLHIKIHEKQMLEQQ